MRGRKRSLFGLLGLVAIIMVMMSALIAPQASASQGDCPDQWLCLWSDYSYNLDIHRWHDNGWQNLEPSFNTVASTVYNHSNRYAELAIDFGGGLPRRCIQPNAAFSLAGLGFDTNTSSVRLIEPPGRC